MTVIQVKDVSIAFTVDSHNIKSFKEYVLKGAFAKRAKEKLFTALNKVSLEISSGESVAILGHNGSGKSTLLKVIAGIVPPTAGTVSTSGLIAPMIELGTGFDPELSGRENIYLSCMIMESSKVK